MELISVIAAGVASYAFGAIWYMALAKPWMAAAGIEVGEDGRPVNSSDPKPYIIALVCAIIVAGMMRHIFGLAGITGFGMGAVAGFGLGAFIAAPWIVTNCGFGGRPMKLALIDGGYAAGGCTVMGIVLGLF